MIYPQKNKIAISGDNGYALIIHNNSNDSAEGIAEMGNNPKEYSIDEWEKLERSELERFVMHYKTQNALDSAQYPAKLSLGEWDEQYRFFEEFPSKA